MPKGKSLLIFPDEYIVVDLETTGLSARDNEIIEIAALKYSHGRKVAEFVTLVKPEHPISYFITNLTGITNQMVAQAPAIKQAIKDFTDFVGNDIIVGYNINFDLNFLYYNLWHCYGKELNNDFVDVLRFARRELRFLPSRSQSEVAKYFGISTKGAHRAAADCEMCNAIYMRFRQKLCRTL